MGTTNAAPPAIVADERHAEWRVEVIKENALHFVFAVSMSPSIGRFRKRIFWAPHIRRLLRLNFQIESTVADNP
jgi:hypothetical protein